MSLSISASLAAHLRQRQRRPAVSVAVTSTRGGMDLLRWRRLYTGSELDAPSAVAMAGDGGLVRARNDSGLVLVSRTAAAGPGANFASWSSLGVCASGTAIALVARAGELLLANIAGSGLTVQVRTSSDDGVTWSAPATVATEASAISNVAAAFNPFGDACLFYTIGASANLKRLRRTSGVWAVSGTNWSRASAVSTLSGIAAGHDGADFALLVTGTEAATNHRRCWAVRMGDTLLPANSWSGLNPVAEADAASVVSFAAPSIATIDGALRGTFARIDAGPVAANRAMETRPMAFTGAAGPWSEPIPHEATGASGVALASGDGPAAWAATPSGVWSAERGGSLEIGPAVMSCRYSIGPRSGRCRIEAADPHGALAAAGLLFVGAAVTIRPGYASGVGGAAEYGASVEFAIERLTSRISGGSRTLVIEGVGPWELANRWRAPQAWQSADGAGARSALFFRLIGRAGLAGGDVPAPLEPGGEWLAGTPAFAIAAGETAASALERLLDSVAAEALPDVGLFARSISAGDLIDGGYGGLAEPPLLGVEPIGEAGHAAWVRLQGSGRSAEAVDTPALAAGAGSLRLLTDRERLTDGSVSEGAAAALHRAAMLAPAATIATPFDPARQIWDVVTVTSPQHGLVAAPFRVVGLTLDFRRGPAGSRCDSLITLGGR